MMAGDAERMVHQELARARSLHAAMQSPHEGYAVILEELEELWTEIRDDKRQKHVRRERMRDEAIQLAAMATRFVIDCT